MPIPVNYPYLVHHCGFDLRSMTFQAIAFTRLAYDAIIFKDEMNKVDRIPYLRSINSLQPALLICGILRFTSL